MSIRSQKLDPNQMQFDFDFSAKVDRYIETREEIEEAIEQRRSQLFISIMRVESPLVISDML